MTAPNRERSKEKELGIIINQRDVLRQVQGFVKYILALQSGFTPAQRYLLLYVSRNKHHLLPHTLLGKEAPKRNQTPASRVGNLTAHSLTGTRMRGEKIKVAELKGGEKKNYKGVLMTQYPY